MKTHYLLPDCKPAGDDRVPSDSSSSEQVCAKTLEFVRQNKGEVSNKTVNKPWTETRISGVAETKPKSEAGAGIFLQKVVWMLLINYYETFS